MSWVSQIFLLSLLVLGSAWAESSLEKTTPRDVEIERLIRERIFLDGAVSADAKKILVRATNGRVTLSGKVDSDFDRLAVERIATVFAGSGVNDELLVAPHE